MLRCPASRRLTMVFSECQFQLLKNVIKPNRHYLCNDVWWTFTETSTCCSYTQVVKEPANIIILFQRYTWYRYSMLHIKTLSTFIRHVKCLQMYMYLYVSRCTYDITCVSLTWTCSILHVYMFTGDWSEEAKWQSSVPAV